MIAQAAWTERTDKRGLDPLGMQNAGINLYQSLLPGISNVTLRMRYYGLYCWLSDTYARLEGADDPKVWRQWVRRTEAALALICSYAGGLGGIGGIEWADRTIALGEGVIDFSEAASDDKSVTRYLRQSLGVFGGAYYTQMVEMGIFTQGGHGIQRASNTTGIALAQAFKASIGQEVEASFVEVIRTARISLEQLRGLATVVPSAIPKDSEELLAYKKMLFAQSDSPKPHDESRAASLKLTLAVGRQLAARPSADDVRWHLFSTRFPSDHSLESQRLRWEAYQCQDLFQVAAAGLLEWSVRIMGESDTGLSLGEIADAARSRLPAQAGELASATWAHLLRGTDTGFDYRDAWDTLTGRRYEADRRAWAAIRLIAAISDRLNSRQDLAVVVRNELAVRGNARSLVSEMAWFDSNADKNAIDVISSYIAERVVMRHNWVAMQKLRRQRDYTFLFELREGRFFRRSGYIPAPTTPRLAPALQFLEDIDLLASEGPTEAGLAVLGNAL